ncbi:MAG: excinuclease ABC subunit UvrB [Armatimonadota bacterium]|nr:excinuclease ABC subunit UvrB [Armatimonadota bacterium]
MLMFQMVTDMPARGDQPKAIAELTESIRAGNRYQTLLGVTGSGKTFTVARVIEQVQRPTLVLAHNKTLAAQLYSEFREFFPNNAVRYFVSYYDYYQPEAYVPQTDLYIAKDASINDEIDRLRHAATKALMERRDVIVVASVSCIYGLGRPEDYKEVMLLVRRGERRTREELVRRLVDIQYERNDIDFARGRFRVRGDVIEVFPAYEERAVRIDLFGDEVERIIEIDPLTGEVLESKDAVALWPAKHWVTTEWRLERALRTIEEELQERLAWFRGQGKLLEAQRLEFRTRYDMELLREAGTCPGIENYSRHLDGRNPGERPGCLIDYFPKDFLLVVDESHVTIPQVRGMLEGDRSRKKNLVDFGFRLPSAFDNRPLAWEEFESLIPQAVFVSATPGPYEMQVSDRIVEQIVRPTGLVDPYVEVRPAQGQVDDLIAEIKAQVARGERTLVTTLTKRMAEDLSAYLQELDFKVHYLHAEIDTLQRVQILKDLRQGTYDVLVGINLLREGLDLPEVSLVAILDADREGYLRSETALIQTMGRAARHISGRVLLYADEVTDSMRRAIDETNRRRQIQLQYNEVHGITPQSIHKPIRDLIDLQSVTEEMETSEATGEILTAEELIKLAETRRAKVPWDVARLLMLSPAELEQTIEALERAMRRAAADLQFEKAAVLRDQIAELRKGLGEPFFAPAGRRRGGPGRGPGRDSPAGHPRRAGAAVRGGRRGVDPRR